jgi:hypothetical protein
MKVGLRTPSPTKKVKAATTGRFKRAAKKAVNPVYGHKGMGYLKDPERAVKNAIYHQVTIDPLKELGKGENVEISDIDIPETPKKSNWLPCILFIISLYCTLSVIFSHSMGMSGLIKTVVGIITLIIGFVLFIRNSHE